jgi:excinuclease ABC subunit C
MNDEKLTQVLDELPRAPGVYLMKGPGGDIVYIGKARNLYNRVRSYYASGKSDSRFIAAQIRRLVSDIDVMVTTSDKEAVLLEASLIKQHRPRYNVKLRDDKDFLCLRLDIASAWPRLEVVRRPKDDGALYFGPYHSAGAARQTLNLVLRQFLLRSCSDSFMATRSRPCLQYQIHRCLAPCVLEVDEDEYRGNVRYTRLFLEGRTDTLERDLEQKMKESSARMEYELAASYRDKLEALRKTLLPQQVSQAVEGGGPDQDVVGLARAGDDVQIAVLQFRGGRLRARLEFLLEEQAFPDDEILSSFVAQAYLSRLDLPRFVLLSRKVEDAAALSQALSEATGRRVHVASPRRGKLAQLALMADQNAQACLASRMAAADRTEKKLQAVQRRLHLTSLPEVVECVDISHFAGVDTVGALSCVVKGKVERSRGRTYRVHLATEGDDYRAMREVLERRFRRAKEGQPGWAAPALLVVDGGRGQLRVARAVLADLGLAHQPVVGLAKERGEGDDQRRDRVFLPDRKNPISVRGPSDPLALLCLARDEAHRLANHYRKKLMSRRTKTSALEAIPGVGPKLRRALLRKFGSLRALREATADELAEVKGVGRALAQRIHDDCRCLAENGPSKRKKKEKEPSEGHGGAQCENNGMKQDLDKPEQSR